MITRKWEEMKMKDQSKKQKLIRLIESDEKSGALKQDEKIAVVTENETLFDNYYESLPFWLLTKNAIRSESLTTISKRKIYIVDKSEF
jgi:DNA-binding transcriptional regulator WhiA